MAGRRETERASRRHRRGLSLIEGLIASIVLAIVAAAAAMALGMGVGAQREAQLQLLAGLAAEQQISSIMEAPYGETTNWAGDEGIGAMLSPPRLNSSGTTIRESLGPAFAQLGRTTTVVAETRTFATYSNFAVPGWRIEVTVRDAANRVYARIVRFRAQEVEP